MNLNLDENDTEEIDPLLAEEMGSVFYNSPGSDQTSLPSDELPISDINTAIQGIQRDFNIPDDLTISSEIGNDYEMPLMPGIRESVRPAPHEGYFPEEDNLPVQQALNGLFGDLGLAQEPLPQDPMMNMMQNSPMASAPGQQEMAGVYPIREDLMPMAVEVLSNSFTSLNESGILLSHQDRLAYATAVMKENTALPSTKKASILNSFMKNGKIIPEILPPDWYISRGAQLKRQSQEKLMMAKNEQINQQNPNRGM